MRNSDCRHDVVRLQPHRVRTGVCRGDERGVGDEEFERKRTRPFALPFGEKMHTVGPDVDGGRFFRRPSFGKATEVSVSRAGLPVRHGRSTLMCGRYVLPDEAAIERFWRIDRRRATDWTRLFNVAPTMRVPIIIRAKDGAIELDECRWGLIPGWWNKDTPPSLTFNARSEEAAQKPTWRQSLRSRRCLMPARGWYEWSEYETARNASGREVKQPYFVFCPNAEVIAFAGLWSVWQRPGAEPVVSCALLSKDALPDLASIHHRMPVVLKPEHYDRWMDPATSGENVACLVADARDDLEGYPVSTRVNDTRNDDPELLQRVARLQ